MYLILLIFFALHSPLIFGSEIKHCYVQDQNKHDDNKKLLRSIVERELSLQDPVESQEDKAYSLARKISYIAKKLIEGGFFIEAYGIPKLGPYSIVAYNCFELWEGDSYARNPIPLTFFVYVWPSEELALKYQKKNVPRHYGSTIHSHPILCAFAILQGAIIQRNYEIVHTSPELKKVRLVYEETFCEYEGDFDDLKSNSIHQLYVKRATAPCLSLHAYGLGSCAKVFRCFRETQPQHSYHD